MQVNSNINSLIQLEKKLEESTNKLAKLTQNGGHASQNEQSELKQNTTPNKHVPEQNEVNLTEEIIEQQVEIPIAYSVNANVVSVQNTTQQTVLDIKA